MKPFSPFDFDPSKMDPKVLMEISQLVQQLPPEKLNQMQTLMHNMAAGHDVRKEMQEFENSLPPEFRLKMASLMAGQAGKIFEASTGAASTPIEVEAAAAGPTSQADMNLHQARITILRAVADGQMSPEDAERLLFSA